MKKTWELPVICVQYFEANEYVAVCWGVGCVVGGPPGNYGGFGENDNWAHWGYTAPSGNYCHDHSGSCQYAVNNQFNVDENNNVSFYAENNSEQGSLNGGFCSYIDNDGDNKVSDGDIIFWYTNGTNGRRWNHYGTVVNADSKHPNRS